MPKHPHRKPAANRPAASRPAEPEIVDPYFIVKGLAAVLGASLILAYLTLCIVYARSAWMLVLQPTHTLASTPAALGLPFSDVHFGVDSTGQPQLDGWWLPANTSTPRTVLLLHGVAGNMADALPTAALYHRLGLNVLLFDYRGYGRSASPHPSQATLQADAHTALNYLLDQRHLAAASIVVYGHDLAAPLALDLCSTAAVNCPALILDAPDGDTFARVAADPRSRAVPASLLFHDRFPLAQPLAASPTPKLLIVHSNNPLPPPLRNARDPKTLLAVQPADDASLTAGIQRFLDETLR